MSVLLANAGGSPVSHACAHGRKFIISCNRCNFILLLTEPPTINPNRTPNTHTRARARTRFVICHMDNLKRNASRRKSVAITRTLQPPINQQEQAFDDYSGIKANKNPQTIRREVWRLSREETQVNIGEF